MIFAIIEQPYRLYKLMLFSQTQVKMSKRLKHDTFICFRSTCAKQLSKNNKDLHHQQGLHHYVCLISADRLNKVESQTALSTSTASCLVVRDNNSKSSDQCVFFQSVSLINVFTDSPGDIRSQLSILSHNSPVKCSRSTD